MLQEFDGELNFATNAWTSPNNKAIVVFTVHLHHKGTPLRMVLDVVEVAESHSGVNLAAAFAKMLNEFQITIKMLGVTADNATPNDVMIDELDDLIELFHGQANHSRCFDHIVNLVAKMLLRQFDVPKGKADTALDEAENSLRELAKDIKLNDTGEEGGNDEDEPADNIDGWDDERGALFIEECAELDASVRPVKFVLVKLWKIASSIIHSSTKLLPAWLKVLDELELAARKMPRDVATWWNSTFRMLEFALEYRGAIDEMTAGRSMELRKFELSDIAEQLCDILRIFNDATLYFSCSTLSLPMVISAIDIINENLTDKSLEEHYKPCIHAAVGLAKKTLNRYYNKTDQSNVYRIAMVLHPSHKLEYFKQAGWEPKWVTTAEEVVREEYERTYAQCKPNVDAPEVVASASKPSANMFDNLLNRNISKTYEEHDELTCYLATETESVDDALVWCKGRLLLSHIRNGLSTQSVHALLCLAEWSQLGLIFDSDVLAITSGPEGEEEDEGLVEGWDAIVLLE
ncbi:putative AC9 transposase [Sparassis crispa]|uniref:Putative AC9 transposase n=1 Tax=Sparassis crispa TaxID=139825 RepID=A0A401GJR6_9APHY|nr:putative AC9 transposase [Sparassis crispa]GBE82417.1 putative AC9 transposase [Sparassis crispa]